MARGKKTGGRQKGTPNIITKDLRERVSNFLFDNWCLVEKDFKTLEPKDRLIFYEKLMHYTLPKLASTDIKENSKPDYKPLIIDWGGNKIPI